MGWWWSSSDDSSKKDAVDKLDPSLRDFLEDEPSVKYIAKRQPTRVPEQTPSRIPTSQLPDPTTAETKPKVPKESLYQDGRYAHLWKNYQSQAVLESKGKTDQEKLGDIIDAYNDKKFNVSKAAEENCAFEQIAITECMKNGSWASRMTMCRAENRTFNRCWEMQGKFLRALGYMTMESRPVDEEEKIQVQADRLYRFMMQQEQMIAEAKLKGEPIPQFAPLLSKENVATVMKGKPLEVRPIPPQAQFSEELRQVTIETPEFSDEFWSNVPKSTRKAYENRLASLTPLEREVERKALEGENRVTKTVKGQLEAAFVEERIHRMERREAGQETIGDTIKRLWGWQ